MALKYIGNGDYILNIPARDLTDDEVKDIQGRFGYTDLRKFLVDSGYYAEPTKSAPKKTKKEE